MVSSADEGLKRLKGEMDERLRKILTDALPDLRAKLEQEVGVHPLAGQPTTPVLRDLARHAQSAVRDLDLARENASRAAQEYQKIRHKAGPLVWVSASLIAAFLAIVAYVALAHS